jgi:peroxiredoxin
MATQSTPRQLGLPAPDFDLPDPRSGHGVRIDDVAGDAGLLVMFICNHCPYVQHVAPALGGVARDLLERGVGVVAISANDPAQYPADAPEAMAAEAERRDWPFPYLFDESQEVAKAYGAVCTPDFFLHDADRKLVYHGQFDDSRPGSGVAPTGSDLRAAVDALVAGEPIPGRQRPSIGCSIKWKSPGGPR